MRILSFGGGVNSTAIIALALLGEIEMPDYIVFSDTGAEWPHTYQYLDYLEREGIRITYLTGGDKGETLIEYCQRMSFLPSRLNRWCSDHWKITPVWRFCRAVSDDFKMIIGIDAGEAHRAEKKSKKYKSFPLIEFGMNRNDCEKIILKAGLGIPRKSGCFICPNQSKGQWIELKKKHPELWNVALSLEQSSRVKDGKRFTYKYGMTIEEFVADLDRQEELPLGIVLEPRCECYFD